MIRKQEAIQKINMGWDMKAIILDRGKQKTFGQLSGSHYSQGLCTLGFSTLKGVWRWRNQFLVDNSRVEMCVIMKRRQPLLLLRNWLVWEMQNRHQHQSPKKGCPSEQSTLHLVRWSTEVLASTASPVINYHSNLVLHQNYTVKSGDCKLLLLDTSRTTYPFL